MAPGSSAPAARLLAHELVQRGLDRVGHPDLPARPDRHVMRLAELAEPFPGLARRGGRLAVRVELEDLAGETAHEIERPVPVDEQTAGEPGELPLLDVGAFRVEDL